MLDAPALLAFSELVEVSVVLLSTSDKNILEVTLFKL